MESSLPAVVRTLAGFEAQLGVRLFNRTTRRISLTEEGRRHLESCRQLLAAVADAEAALTADATEPAGHLTITAPMLFGQMHVAPAVTRFVQQHDKMRCSMVLLDRVVNLLEEGIDVGIRIGDPGRLQPGGAAGGPDPPPGGGQPRLAAPARRAAAPQGPAQGQLRAHHRAFPHMGPVQ